MHRSIDMKSILIGGLLAALILCLAGAVPYVNLEDYDRFKIETNDSHAFVLDSATGQVWSSVFHVTDSGFTMHSPDPNFLAIKTLHGAIGQ
jgi:hypothetical protein